VLGSALDANGNTLSDPSGKQYSWNFENQLTSVTVPNVGTTTFRYDPFGQRIQKSGPLGTTNYLYDGPNIIEEADQSGNVLARYTQERGIDQPLAELRSGTAGYYEQDGVVSVTALTNSAGAVANTYSYDSFGKVTASTGTLANPFQYTGREFDSETGIYEYRHRYYDASVGRFLSEDPTGFDGGVNFYSYVRNWPTRATDPFGLVTVIPLPPDHVHTLPDIDPNCGVTAGGCNKVDYRPDFTCEKGPNCKWTARFTIRLVGDIYVASGPFPYKGRQPADRSVRNSASALAHENQHTNDEVNAIVPIFQRVEGQSFDSESDCQNAAANAEVQAAAAWAQAAADSQRRRH
jgi:RHS repeat-associated protein